MKPIFVSAALSAATVLAISPASVLAGDSGFYIGGSIGNADISYDDNHSSFGDVNFDDDDSGYKVFAGINFNLIDLLNLAVEASYVDFGEQEGSIANITGNKLEVDAWTAAALAGVDLGPIGVFAKAGFASWDGDVSAGNSDFSEDGTDPLYGVGAKFQIGSLAVRGEYEIYDLEDIDIDYISVGLSYTF